VAPGLADRRLLAPWLALIRLSAVLVLFSPAVAFSQTRPAPVAHSQAWRALEAHRYDLAARLFEAAAPDAPDDPSLAFGAGVSALMRGLNDPAREWFERALAIEPDLTDASILLGQALYRSGRVVEAIDAYERALVYEPDDPELVAPLRRWRLEIGTETSFDVLAGPHFSVRYPPGDQPLAQRALGVLESAYPRLMAELGGDSTRTLEVVLYTPEQFKVVTELPAWAVGIYDGRIKVPLGGTSASTADLRRVLEHELVHAIVAGIAGPTVPAWLNEGLATALEPDGVRWMHEAEMEAPSPPVADLPLGFRGLAPGQARTAYAASARVVQRLFEGYGTHAVAALLRAIGKGVPFSDAFYDTIGKPFELFAASVP
jgi:tetratricopeptide (TPR) repeat protein